MQCIEEAKTYAERKLTLIIEREGDCGGARREGSLGQSQILCKLHLGCK